MNASHETGDWLITARNIQCITGLPCDLSNVISSYHFYKVPPYGVCHCSRCHITRFLQLINVMRQVYYYPRRLFYPNEYMNEDIEDTLQCSCVSKQEIYVDKNLIYEFFQMIKNEEIFTFKKPNPSQRHISIVAYQGDTYIRNYDDECFELLVYVCIHYFYTFVFKISEDEWYQVTQIPFRKHRKDGKLQINRL